MSIHRIPVENWHMALADTIRTAAADDTIVCRTKAMMELAIRARDRLCPNKSLLFVCEQDKEAEQ